MENRGVLITRQDNLVPTHKMEHDPYEYSKYKVTERDKGYQCFVAFYEIPPRKANYPYHYHLKSEEVFYIISGSGIVETPEGNKTISAGDVIICPASEEGAHKLINTSATEKLVYIDIDTVHKSDIVNYPKSGKIGIVTEGNPTAFYHKDSNVGYYEGE